MPTDIFNLLEHFDPAEIDERIKQISEGMSLFKENHAGYPIEYKNGAAIEIAIKYFEWIDRFVKPYLNDGSRINAYKIASCTELVVALIQPIVNNPECRHANAKFGMFCACNIIANIKNSDAFIYDTGRGDLDERLVNFLKNHLRYMELIDISQNSTPPIIANAATWELLHYFEMYKFQCV
jgi:hypothetical protein